MRTILILLLGFIAGCGGCASVPTHEQLRATAVRLEFVQGVCSGTALAPDRFATAVHCFRQGPLLRVNGAKVAVVRVTDDKRDHAEVLIRGVSFTSWVKRGPLPKQGDRVRWFGNPRTVPDIYRQGYVAAVSKDLIIVDAMTCRGDSGSGLLNDKGELVGIISAITEGNTCLFGVAFRE